MKTNNIGCHPLKGPAAVNFKQSHMHGEPYNTTFASDLKYAFTGAGIITALMAVAVVGAFKKRPQKTGKVIKEELLKIKGSSQSKNLPALRLHSKTGFLPAIKNKLAEKKDILRSEFKKLIGKYGYDTTVIKAPDGFVYVQVNHGKDLVGSVSYKDAKIIQQSSNFFSRFDKNSLLTFEILA